MVNVSETHPWYKVRWQIWVFGLIGIPLSILFTKYVTRIPEVSVASGPIGQNKTLKDRMVFVVNLEKSFHKRGWPASIDLEGADGKVLKVYWEKIDLPFVRHMAKDQGVIGDTRELGFKKMVLRSDREHWEIDLKN